MIMVVQGLSEVSRSNRSSSWCRVQCHVDGDVGGCSSAEGLAFSSASVSRLEVLAGDSWPKEMCLVLRKTGSFIFIKDISFVLVLKKTFHVSPVCHQYFKQTSK